MTNIYVIESKDDDTYVIGVASSPDNSHYECIITLRDFTLNEI